MDKRERLKKQMDFIIEVDKVKNIVRQTYLADGKRKENDAEHSWHLALMAVLLKEYAGEEIDLSRVIPIPGPISSTKSSFVICEAAMIFSRTWVSIRKF